MRNPYPHLVDVIQSSMIAWLREVDEPAAADYFQKTWTGNNGHYMLAHGGNGITPHQSGVEAVWRWTKAATTHQASSEFPDFLSNLSVFLKERSREACSQHDKLGLPRWTFPSKPTISKKTWDKVQDMHPLTLHMSSVIPCGKEAQVTMNRAMNSLFDDFDPSEMSLASYISMKNREEGGAHSYRVPLRKSITVIMPSQVMLVSSVLIFAYLCLRSFRNSSTSLTRMEP